MKTKNVWRANWVEQSQCPWPRQARRVLPSERWTEFAENAVPAKLKLLVSWKLQPFWWIWHNVDRSKTKICQTTCLANSFLFFLFEFFFLLVCSSHQLSQNKPTCWCSQKFTPLQARFLKLLLREPPGRIHLICHLFHLRIEEVYLNF